MYHFLAVLVVMPAAQELPEILVVPEIQAILETMVLVVMVVLVERMAEAATLAVLDFIQVRELQEILVLQMVPAAALVVMVEPVEICRRGSPAVQEVLVELDLREILVMPDLRVIRELPEIVDHQDRVQDQVATVVPDQILLHQIRLFRTPIISHHIQLRLLPENLYQFHGAHSNNHLTIIIFDVIMLSIYEAGDNAT
jgi:hypothetical protein